ncbi:MAG: hypothetical protein KAJ18_01805, partial [Candidatus Omnitrophica bacterium]|nr:hypothetical protein [Candidatus Omnitrophota bacterium]
MISKQRKKHIRRAFARHGMFFGYWLVGVLPFCFVKIVLKGLLAIVFYFAKRLRKITRESLMIAFGEQKNEEEIQKITHGCFAAIGKNIIELMYYLHHPARAPKIFSFEGREHLDQALAQGKGVIAVTAHFGNFPLMLLDLAQEGYKINVIMREARDKKVAKYILKIMSDRMVHTIHTKPRRKCVMEAFRTLRNNEILFILMDQHFGSDGGVFV